MDRTTQQEAGWRRSVSRVVEKLPPRDRGLLLHTLGELPAKIASRYPYDALALTALAVFDNVASMDKTLRLSVLVARGYDMGTALIHYTDLMKMVRIPLHMLQVMPASQLKSEFGLVGALVADTLVDPDTQPYFHAMLTGQDPNSVERKFAEMHTRSAVADMRSVQQMNVPNISIDVIDRVEMHDLDANQARYLYQRCTDFDHFPRTNIDPHTLEHLLCLAPTPAS